MKTLDIVNVIEGFIDDEASAILIDGKWGIGKTYAIERFLGNGERRREKIYYLSLFGFKDVELLHKELYAKLHPVLAGTARALSYVSLAAPLIKGGVTVNTEKIKEDFQDASGKGKLYTRKRKTVVIFDDLERVAAGKEGFIALLGYFSRLINEGIKVVAVCNSHEIPLENLEAFGSFKEKIFDRTYTANETDEEVVKKIFGEAFSFIGEEEIAFFEQNLRLVKKTKLFFDDVLKRLSAKRSLSALEKKNVCLICILVVKHAFGVAGEAEKKDNGKLCEGTDKEAYSDEACVDKIEKVFHSRGNYYVDGLIRGLYAYFKYYDESVFNDFSNERKRLFTKSLYYYGDEEREAEAKRIEEVIERSFGEYDADALFDGIRELLNYAEEEFTEKERIRVIERIVAESDEKKKKRLVTRLITASQMIEQTALKSFAEQLDKRLEEDKNSRLVEYFKALKPDDYDGELLRFVNGWQNGVLSEELCGLLIANAFFLPDLSKTITPNSWDYCHDVASFILKLTPKLKNKFIAVLDENVKRCPSSKCLKKRTAALKAKLAGKA